MVKPGAGDKIFLTTRQFALCIESYISSTYRNIFDYEDGEFPLEISTAGCIFLGTPKQGV